MGAKAEEFELASEVETGENETQGEFLTRKRSGLVVIRYVRGNPVLCRG